MRRTKKEQQVMLLPIRDLTKSELLIYQRVSKRELEEKLSDIKRMHRRGQDLTGQDSIFVLASIGYIPCEYTA